MITGAGLLEETGAVSSASADAPAVVVAGALVEGASEAASDSYVSTLAIGIIGAGSADQTYGAKQEKRGKYMFFFSSLSMPPKSNREVYSKIYLISKALNIGRIPSLKKYARIPFWRHLIFFTSRKA